MNRLRLVCLCLCVAASLPGAAGAQEAPIGGNRYRPGLDFKTLTLGRFDVHFHQGEEALAQRLARIIQAVAPDLEQRYGSPSGRVRVILVDQADVSNGWATVTPYNLIELAAVPPPGRSPIGNTDDWLRLVFTHEYTHILHLEKSGGWFGSLRRVFGRVPAFYPNLFVPDWQIEGLATFEESARTGAGRVPAGDFESMLDRAALEGRFAPLDRATSAVIDWPGGSSSYLFGAYFHQFLAERYGADRFARLADATAARLPFTGSRAFKSIYGKSLGTLWREFEADVERKANAAALAEPRNRITTHGFTTASPVYTRDGRLLYAASTPHDFPSINEVRPDGTVHRLVNRYHGSRVAVGGDWIVFDQLELAANVALTSDLYARGLSGGPVRRLTRAARAADPDVSPDGRTIVCTVQRTGQRILATMALDPDGAAVAPSPLIEQNDTEFSAPRWSPDGRLIVAERRTLGGASEIVLIDYASREVRTLVSTTSGRNMLPTWLPDGSAILFSSDRDAREFTLYSLDLSDRSVRRVNTAGTGAQSAVVSPGGDRLVLVGLSAAGHDLYSIPFAEEGMLRGPQTTVPVEDIAIGPSTASVPLPSRAYSPLNTLLPRFWIPYAETDGDDTVVGAATTGFDALGRHAYTVTGGWAVPRNRADLQFDYTYSRWWPALFVSASDDTDAWREGHIRSRELNAGVLLPWRRVRWNTSVLAAGSISRDDFERSSEAFPARADRRRDALRLGWSASSARAYPYSISGEEGASLSIVSEFASGGSGDRGTATSVAGSLRGYLRAWPRHGVVAVRLAGATSGGDPRVRREFSAGGSGPQGGGFDIGVDAVGLLRGFDDDDLFGRSVALLNADYRFPLGWPQRGSGTLPVFLRAVHGAVFIDLGHAWEGRLRADDLRRSVGGELSFDTVLASYLPLTIATGVAWRDDPSGRQSGAAFFARIGRAF
jgi:hypothetical protein